MEGAEPKGTRVKGDGLRLTITQEDTQAGCAETTEGKGPPAQGSSRLGPSPHLLTLSRWLTFPPPPITLKQRGARQGLRKDISLRGLSLLHTHTL